MAAMAASAVSVVPVQDEFKGLFVGEGKAEYPIILVDASYSTGNVFSTNQRDTMAPLIFQQMQLELKKLSDTHCRIIFWASPQGRRVPLFTNGFFIPPLREPISIHDDGPNSLTAIFNIAGSLIASGFTTEPHLGFNAIPDDWLAPGRKIILVTDGNIGYQGMDQRERNLLEAKFAESIQGLSKRKVGGRLVYPTPNIQILAIMNQNVDLSNERALESAGGDMYRVMRGKNLTTYVSKFTTVMPGGTFVQLEQFFADPGHVPYEGKQFHIKDSEMFIVFFRTEISKPEHQSMDVQIRFIQKIANTLRVLLRDAHPKVREQTVAMYAGFFNLDRTMTKDLINQAIDAESAGQAQVFGEVRANLKDKFARADQAIKAHAATSCGITELFMSALYGTGVDRAVLVGPADLLKESINLHGEFKEAAFMGVVGLPLWTKNEVISDMAGQCTRQFIRAWFAKQYSIHPTSDEIIYLVLGTMVVVHQSPLPDHIKGAWSRLGKVMLEKKRLTTQETEYDRLLTRVLPIPNSNKFDDFTNYMNAVKRKLGIDATNWRLWGEMCRCVSQELFEAQEVHVGADMGSPLRCEGIVHLVEVPKEVAVDYTDVVSAEDLAATGGLRYKPHRSAAREMCSPNFMISRDTLQHMIASGTNRCLVCYRAGLTMADFDTVGPRPAFDLPKIFREDITEKMQSMTLAGEGKRDKYSPYAMLDTMDRVPSAEERVAPVVGAAAGAAAAGPRRVLVVLQGVVGSGKSTLAEQIRAFTIGLRGECYVEGMDKYARQGINGKQAAGRVTQALNRAKSSRHPGLVAVVIDVCNENYTGTDEFFRVNFRGWTKVVIRPNFIADDIHGYLAWSLRNVLRRPPADANCNYFLCPSGAGLATCLNVHKMKAEALFFAEIRANPRLYDFRGGPIKDEIIASLDAEADAYQAKIPRADLSAIFGAEQ